MRYEVTIHPEAEEELARAYDWILEDSKSAEVAEKWRRGLLAKARTLHVFPERCTRAPEAALLGEDIRQLLYGKRSRAYRLLFVIQGRSVVVIRIRHGARRHETDEIR